MEVLFSDSGTVAAGHGLLLKYVKHRRLFNGLNFWVNWLGVSILYNCISARKSAIHLACRLIWNGGSTP